MLYQRTRVFLSEGINHAFVTVNIEINDDCGVEVTNIWKGVLRSKI